MSLRALPILLALGVPAAAGAQALHCPIPRTLPRSFPERVPDDQEPRVRPVTGYVLALSWSPQHCAGRADRPRDRLQCREGRFGFVLHGLWPQARDGPPAWCAHAPRLSEPLIRGNLCVSPSPQLIQHQWAKHGTCVTGDPADYLRASARLFRAVRIPDLAGVATIGALRSRFATANPRFPQAAIGTATTRQGWLAEVMLCLDTRFRARRCNAYERGREDRRPLRIRPIPAGPTDRS